MAITPLPTPPNRNDPTNFPVLGDAFLAAMPQFALDANSLAANLNSVAAGGAYSIPLTIDLSSTSDANPGAGKIRFDNASQNAATTLRVNTTGANGSDFTSVLDTFDASTSVIKGTIRLVKQNDTTKFLVMNVTARATATGYRNITIAVVQASGTNPFAANDSVMLFFQRTGDQGNAGGSLILLLNATLTGATNVNYLNVFNSGYDQYIIEIEGASTANDTLSMRFAKGGSVDTAQSYYYSPVSGTGLFNSSTAMSLSSSSGPCLNISSTIRVRNVNGALSGNGNMHSCSINSVQWAGSTSYYGNDVNYAYVASGSAATGFQLFWGNGSTFNGGTLRVFGFKNT